MKLLYNSKTKMSSLFYPFNCTLGSIIPEPNFEFHASLASSTGSVIQIVQSNLIDTLSCFENGGQGTKLIPCCVGIN